MRIIFSSFIFFSFFSYFLIFRIFHLISSFAPHLIATSSSSCSSRVLYLAECWTFCFLEVDGSVLKTLFHWFDHHFSVMRICVWGVRLDHSFQYWLISAVGQCGGLGRRARPLALCEGYPNIVQACDDSKAGCANKRLVYPFSGPSGRGGTYAAGARLRHATVANHVLLLHHSPPSKAALHSVLSWLTRLFHPSMSCTGADLLYCSTRLCSTYVVGAGLWMGVLSTHK